MFYKKYIFLIIFVLISIIPILDLFKSGLPLTHDGQDHVARIANFYQNLSEGNLIPRWAGNLNWGYGHPILEFLYPLPSYIASFFHFLGFSLVDSVKLVFGIAFILSGLTMYLLVRELLEDKMVAFFSGLLYIIAPYRFVDLYVRGAIGEHVAFIFPPLIFYFLLKLSKHYSNWYVIGGAVSVAALNLSHNAISLMFLPLFGLYALFLLFKSKDKVRLIGKYLITLLLGFGLSAFFWIPAFMEGKYTLRDVVTGGGEYLSSFVNWKDFFFGQWSYGGTLFLSKQVGIFHWGSVFGAIFAFYHFYKKKNKLWVICLGGFIIFWVTLFLMTSASDFIWQAVTILQKFQFSWRFLSIIVFLSSLMGGILLFVIPTKYKKAALLVLILSLMMVSKDYWHAQDFLRKEDSFYSGIYSGTTDTGESAPVWSVRFMEKRPESKVKIISGKGQIKEVKRDITNREYRVSALEKVRVLENTLYFPGWNVFVDGKFEQIEFQDQNYRGLITFFVDKGEHNIRIVYEETKIRLFSNTASIISLLVLAGLVFVKPGFGKRYRSI
ncbi:MAG: 6-pyruvoyl-tetrahydropterin synthase-related protein [Candidatus Levybacteria bacterium]|nr:6-pyruvoyl-tetrahydropterin synthase-related protein [Candidatus Levybacteria bacterium]